MSSRAIYLLHYEPQPYLSPTPMDIDTQFLIKFSGTLEWTGWYDVVWVKDRGELTHEEVYRLLADQVLVSVDGDAWKDAKAGS
jgi:hypothetical protein